MGSVIKCAVDGSLGYQMIGRKSIGAMCAHIACGSNECRDKTGSDCEYKVTESDENKTR